MEHGLDGTAFKQLVQSKLDILNGKEEEELVLSNFQRNALVTALKQLIEQKVITDKTWIEKAEKRHTYAV